MLTHQWHVLLDKQAAWFEAVSVFKNLFIVVKSQAGSIFDESRLSNLIAQRVQSSDFGTAI